MSIYDDQFFEVKRDEDGKLYGNGECIVCTEKYKWSEKEGAYVIVSGKTENGIKKYLDFHIYLECPKCGYKIKNYGFERKDQYK